MAKQTRFSRLCSELRREPKTWLITGVAGFIGSNLLETLLLLDQKVVGVDNFMTGYQRNLDMVREIAGEQRWGNFYFEKGDVRDPDCCRRLAQGADYVLHQAALGSVPRSIDEPLLSNGCNITGHLNMLAAARDAGVRGFVYAASSATYGDEPTLPKQEDKIGSPLSPYALTKYVNELYAAVFARCYGYKSIGLRYFNVFGKRQDPDGAYAAVIPLWFKAMLRGEPITVNGDGETTRDFCYIDNCVQANILAACAEDSAKDRVYNIAFGESTSLNELFEALRREVTRFCPQAAALQPVYGPFRDGDIRHSVADISRACNLLGYAPEYDVRQGLSLAAEWYYKNL